MSRNITVHRGVMALNSPSPPPVVTPNWRVRGPMSNISKRVAAAAKTREQRYRSSLNPPYHLNRKLNRGFDITTMMMVPENEYTANGQHFKYGSKGELLQGNEWVGSNGNRVKNNNTTKKNKNNNNSMK